MNQKVYEQDMKLVLSISLAVIIIIITLLFSQNTMRTAKRIQQETLNMIDSESITDLIIEVYTTKDIYYCDFYYNIITTESGKRLIFDSDLELKDFIAEITAEESK